MTDVKYISLTDCWRVVQPDSAYKVNITKVSLLSYSIEEYGASHIKIKVKWCEQEKNKGLSPKKEELVLDKSWANGVEDWLYGRLDFFKTFPEAKKIAVSCLEYNLIQISREIQDLVYLSPDEWE